MKHDEDALRALVARAAQDGEFRSRLLRDPRQVIRQVTGTQVPEGLRIKFVEKDPDTDVMIVLPDLVADDCELTEEDVAQVAGGTGWGCADVTTS